MECLQEQKSMKKGAMICEDLMLQELEKADDELLESNCAMNLASDPGSDLAIKGLALNRKMSVEMCLEKSAVPDFEKEKEIEELDRLMNSSPPRMASSGSPQAAVPTSIEQKKPEPEEEKFVGKPTFSQVISGQTSAGNWTTQSRPMFAACFVGNSTEDKTVRDALEQVIFTDDIDREAVYMTLLACYILEETFADFEDEWQLIASKARKWLETAGV